MAWAPKGPDEAEDIVAFSMPQNRIWRTIGTFNQSNLKPSDFVDLSGRRAPYIQLVNSGPAEFRYQWRRHLVPFPPHTHGFLYYHLPSNLPPTCGEIRFRVTEISDPKRIAEGTDLISMDGIPWSISSVALAFPPYAAVRKRLLHDRVVSVSHLDTMKKLLKKFGVNRTSIRDMCYLEQPFVFNMNVKATVFRVITDSEVCSVRILDIFVDTREHRTLIPPYQGRLVLRFERSTLPDDAGTNTIVLRVLKILDPIKLANPTYDAWVPMPQEGQLLLRRRFSQVIVRSWDLDKQAHAAFKKLPSIEDVPAAPSITRDLVRSWDLDEKTQAAFKKLPSIEAPDASSDLDEKAQAAFKKLPSIEGIDTPSTTLDPDRLTRGDFVDLSGLKHHPQYPKCCIYYSGISAPTAVPFPPNTRGFLYYYLHHPLLPPTSGMLRFRLTPDNDPDHFANGHDLPGLDGTPWSTGLFTVTHASNVPLQKQLLQDGLVTQPVLDTVKKLRGGFSCLTRKRRELYYLEQPFAIEMSSIMSRIGVVVGDRIESVKLSYLFTRKERVSDMFSGTLLVHFERSTQLEHEGRNMAVLRLVKILKPIEPVIPGRDTVPPPLIEGKLLVKEFSRGGHLHVLAWDMDKPNASCLKHLPSINGGRKAYGRNTCMDLFSF